jgi:hypothetical protein
MNKTDLIVRCLIPVLSAGLVSCAKDEKTRDVFHAPAPVIHSKSTEELKSWDRRSDKSLDLQDSFDVSAGNPARLEVVSRCRRGQQSYYESFSFTPRAPVKIFQVLPAELLTAAIENVDCGFELTLFNDVGSKHIYQINQVPVTDESAAGVTLEKSGSDEKITKIHARKLEGLRARYRNSGPAAAEVLCEESALPALPFEQVIDLIHFEFSKLSGKAFRACRILVRQAGRIGQISPRFLVQIPQAPMIVTAETVAPNDGQLEYLQAGAPLTVARIAVSNPAAEERFLMIGKGGSDSSVGLFYPPESGRQGTQPAQLMQFDRKWSFFFPQPVPGVAIEDKGAHYLVTIPAGGRALLIMQIRPPGRKYCKGNVLKITKNVILAGQTDFIEISKTGETLGTVRAGLPRSLFFLTVPPSTAVPPPSEGPCRWF